MNNHNRSQSYALDNHGLTNVGNVYWNLSTPALYEEIVRRREGQMAHLGPIVVRTGNHTGRAANDKFIVKEPTTEDNIWWGNVNVPFNVDSFNNLYHRLLAYFQGKDVFVQDCYAGADPEYRIPIRVITEDAWHNLFARNLFIQANSPEQLSSHIPEFVVINAPRFYAIPEVDHTNSEAFIIVNFEKKLIIIGGTSYAGEIKKSIFTIMNYLLPEKNVLSMHCSANIGKRNDVALFFGLSGTGKTTLSADVERMLIGDDEHGWSEKGVFNFEGGCYAKVISLSEEAEPDIYKCTRRFGTILENVGYDFDSRKIDLFDNSLTENTRAAYPISHINNAQRSGIGGIPENIIFLTCDAFGVLPPIAKLTPEQAMYHFLSGYTAKLAGTESGSGSEPSATFSACFGAPFMARPATVYAELLGKKINAHKANCWLINTGWSGGTYGTGSRMEIKHTRAMVNAALNGHLNDVTYEEDPIFKVQVPTECPNVPTEVLKPKNTWLNQDDYTKKALELARMFNENFKQFESDVGQEILKAAPVMDEVVIS